MPLWALKKALSDITDREEMQVRQTSLSIWHWTQERILGETKHHAEQPLVEVLIDRTLYPMVKHSFRALWEEANKWAEGAEDLDKYEKKVVLRATDFAKKEDEAAKKKKGKGKGKQGKQGKGGNKKGRGRGGAGRKAGGEEDLW